MQSDIPIYVEQLWKNWIENQESDTINDLIKYYMYLVEFQVERIGNNIPPNVDKGDLQSLGLLGLFNAIQKFNPNKGVKFDTYGSIRIRGAIMDGLRKEDWLPRNMRDQVKKLRSLSNELEQSLQRKPTKAEIAEKMMVTEIELVKITTAAYEGNVLSMEQQQNEDGLAPIPMLHERPTSKPDLIIEKKEIRENLTLAIKKLKRNEQLVISLLYIEELTFTEIGEVLELSTSRISQIHKQAVSRLKTMLSGLYITI